MATQASPLFLHLAHSSAAEMATPKNGRSKKLLVRERALGKLVVAYVAACERRDAPDPVAVITVAA